MPQERVADRHAREIREAVNAALERYKAKVLEVASEARDENGWCQDGFRRAMEDLNIEIKEDYRVTVELRFTIRDQPSSDVASEEAESAVSRVLVGELDDLDYEVTDVTREDA